MIELPVMIKSFLSDFEKVFKFPNLTTNSLIYIPRGYEELIAEVIGYGLKKTVCVVPASDTYIPKFNTVSEGDKLDMSLFTDLGYTIVERVWNVGEVSILGDVIVIWPYSSKHIFRIQLLGNLVESIDILEPDSRKKIESVKFLRLSNEKDTVLANENEKEVLVLRYTNDLFSDEDCIDLGIQHLPNIGIYSGRKSSINLIKSYEKKGYSIWYVTKDLFRYDEDSLNVDRVYEAGNSIEKNLNNGFIYGPAKIILLTDREVLGELDLDGATKSKNLDPSSVEILRKITPGDFVVHQDHGIGKYVGITEKNGTTYIELAYAGNDKLYVPFSASSKIMKYIGAKKYQPKLTGLNSGVWKRVSLKAASDIENTAKELLQIYALREVSLGRAVLRNKEKFDEYWKFADEFEFTDTEDQYIATQKIAEDLSRNKPMDRLLVGDVGFGKTEIAMRATFAVVNDGMQVAILAPTTVLTEQHLRVFRERFKKYPFRIESLSRLQSSQDREKILSDLENGKVDIVIGTHAVLSERIKFSNLGLIVVDEEQKFGVKQKEKLKSRRVDTHVLSMTATPIPRTLNLSLLGVRDISVLAIPPYGRVEIKNEFHQFDFDKVKECIVRELNRNGQVYYLHNSIQNIKFIEQKIKEMLPNIRVEVMHGRLSSERVISTMDLFLNGKIDVLLCTTIIENGLDIANANTLIVDDVNRLGLSQMYQIRGRVGRGERQAYACFFYDTLKGDSALRLEAIKESQALGSGFLLSNRDLEIRGAGDILGKRQSGTINLIGYGLYTQLLSEAVKKLKSSSR